MVSDPMAFSMSWRTELVSSTTVSWPKTTCDEVMAAAMASLVYILVLMSEGGQTDGYDVRFMSYARESEAIMDQ